MHEVRIPLPDGEELIIVCDSEHTASIIRKLLEGKA